MDFRIKNFTMEKFNNDVNHSGDLDEKYLRWADYRVKINEFIKKHIENKQCESIFVFGAGECNDIDLKFLSNTFKEITLSDIDIASIEEGILRQRLSESVKAKINVVQADYTGLDTIGFFDNITDQVNERKTEKEISGYIKTTISNMKNSEMLSAYKNKYSMVLVLPTYTQLIYTQMEALLRILYQYNAYEVDDLNKIITSMYHSMPEIINSYNDLMLSLMNDNGNAIVLVDVLEITDRQAREDIASQIDHIEYIKKYLHTNCSDLAQLGLDNLKTRIDILDEEYAIWPFDDSKDYIVNILINV